MVPSPRVPCATALACCRGQVHERMLESYVVARDRFLKPGGKMLPTLGEIIVSPISDETLHQEQTMKASFWETDNYYGIDLTP